MPQGRYDPFMGNLPPVNEDPRKVAQGQQPVDPLGGLGQMIGQSLGAAPPPQRNLNQWEILAGLSNPQLMEYVLGLKNQTPQMQQYGAQQKMLPHLLDAYSAQQRSGNFQQKEARLDEQFKWRQLLQSQYKRNPVGLFNPETGLNERWVVFTDPLNNNVEVGRVPEAFAQMHYGAVAGPGGEMYQYPTSPQPGRGAIPGGGKPQGGPLQRGGAPANPAAPPPLPTGTPTSKSGVVPNAQPGGNPPVADNVRRLGLAKQPGASVSQNYAAQSAFLSSIEELLDIQRQANQEQVKASGEIGTSPGGLFNYGKQTAKELMTRSEFTQPLLSTMEGGQNIIGYRVRMMPKLFNYVKAQTGVQFGYREFLQYSSQFPTSLDNPETARQKIDSLVYVIRTNKAELERQFHALGQAQAPMIGGRRLEMTAEQFESMQEEDPQAAQEFIQDGGVVR